MRVSTSQVYALGVAGIARQQEKLLHTQQQVATGKRVLTPSDDPVASTQALEIDQAASRLEQYSANIDVAKAALGLDESVLSQVTDILQSIRTTAVNAGGASLSDADRASLAGDVQGRLEQLMALANSKDGNGKYMYAGFAVDTQPFVVAPSGAVAYQGDQGVRVLDAAPGRAMALGENGAAVFERVRNGNGVFVASAAASNAGSGVIAPGQVTNPSALSGHAYELQFNVVAGVTTYDVFDVTAGVPVSAGNAFTPGGAITIAGEQTSITGAPANGDRFTLAPSTAQSVFTTIEKLVAALKVPATGASGSARLANALNAALTDLDQDLNHVLAVRADVGARLRELDSLSAGNDDRKLQYAQTRSDLIDLDYNQALSDFAKQQIALEAAQKSFVQVSGLSLFDYL
jgi:flagellar hook-associated protein 3 FlgL